MFINDHVIDVSEASLFLTWNLKGVFEFSC